MPRIEKRGLKLRPAFLASGGGTTVLAALKECAPGGRIHEFVEPAVIIVSKPGVPALERPKEVPGMEHVPTRVVQREFGKKSPEQFGDELLAIFDEFGVDMFHQMGWLPKTPANVLARYHGVNQHPAPPRRFGGKGMHGLAAHAARLYYVRATGGYPATVVVSQWVSEKYDEGGVIQYEEVPILTDDTPESLAARALEIEWRVQIRTLAMLACGTAREKGIPCLFDDPFEPGSIDGRAIAWARNRAIANYPHG